MGAEDAEPTEGVADHEHRHATRHAAQGPPAVEPDAAPRPPAARALESESGRARSAPRVGLLEKNTRRSSRSSAANETTLASPTTAKPTTPPTADMVTPAKTGPTISAARSMLAIHELMVASSAASPAAQAVGTQSFLMETLDRVAPSTSAHPQTTIPHSSSTVSRPAAGLTAESPSTRSAPTTPSDWSAMPARITVIRGARSIYAPAAGPIANLIKKMASPKTVGAMSEPGVKVSRRSGVANSQPLEPSFVSVCERSRLYPVPGAGDGRALSRGSSRPTPSAGAGRINIERRDQLNVQFYMYKI
eukprot:scaffold12292_cov112-Isochrysis_galbana.AAC.8